jgi:hypothetical protein
MLAADTVTDYYKKHGHVDSTTMRGNPYPKWTPQWYVKYHNLFYSMSQVFATLNILYYREMGRLFIILLPIQTAPFCMTLVKKGIIDQFAWHFYYTSVLLVNFVYGALEPLPNPIVPAWFYWATAISFMVLRFGFGYNKYLLWRCIVIASTVIYLCGWIN